MKVLVCGDREGFDRRRMIERLAKLPKGTVIINGCCRGVDQMADRIARLLGFGVERYPAEWKRFGRAAGPVRNKQMLAEGQPDLVLAFHHHYERSRGTKNMVKQSREWGVEVEINV